MIWEHGFHRRAGQPAREPIRRDPLSIGVAFLVNIGYGGTISALGATLIGSVILGAAGLGLQYLASAIFQPQQQQQPKPTDRQATLRQSTGPRLRFYGTNLLGGTQWFFESRSGILYSAVTLNEGEISAINEILFNDAEVEIDGSGYVTTDPYTKSGGGSYVRVKFKMGTSAQTAESMLTGPFPEVTANHRLRGTAYVTAAFEEVARDQISKVYPTGNPAIRILADCSIVKSVRTGTRIWSDNPADCIYDYLTGRDDAGFAYGSGYPEDKIDLLSFQAFADVCDVLVPLKAGGSVKKYLLWGGYGMTEQQRQVLPRLLANCDAELFLTNEGKIGIRGGVWTEPSLVLDDTLGHIISAEFTPGQKALAAFNDLTIRYLEPALDYSEAEAERWLDTANIDLRGKELSSSVDFLMSPNHSQARRLGKIHTGKKNPAWAGRIVTNFYGMNAINESRVRIRFSPLGIDMVFDILSIRIAENMTNVELQVSSLSPEIYEWDAATEEGVPPSIPPDTATGGDLAPPSNVVIQPLSVEGAVVFVITWDAPTRPALTQQVQYVLAGETTGWLDAPVAQDQNAAQTGPVEANEDYDIRVRTLSAAGTPGEWQVFANQFAYPAPKPLTGVSVTGGLGNAALAFKTPASSVISTVKLYRAPTGVTLNKVTHLVTSYPVAPSTTYAKVDGDNTPTNLFLNPDFSTGATWTLGTGWSIGSGVATKTPGSTGALSQAVSLSIAAVYRIGLVISGWTTGSLTARLTGGVTQNATAFSANGQLLRSITAVTGNNTAGFNAGSTFNGNVDSAVIFAETGTCAPQGIWDYYLEPVSDAGVAGTLSGPYTRTVV